MRKQQEFCEYFMLVFFLHTDLQTKKCVLLLANQVRVQKFEENLSILRERKEELLAEVAKLENDLTQSQSIIYTKIVIRFSSHYFFTAKQATEEIQQVFVLALFTYSE
jgi:vacuolar-type H+-ATPase subunit D/Vma8